MKTTEKMFLLLLLCPMLSCQSFQSTTSKSNSYEENITSYRPRYEAPADSIIKGRTETVAISKKRGNAPEISSELDKLLSDIYNSNKQYKKAPGYRVQVYTGRSRSEANETKEKIYSKHPDASIHIQYKQPVYTVRVGDYFDRLDAQPMYISLKEDFSNVLVVPDNIEISDKRFK